jgi:hypothetical protein
MTKYHFWPGSVGGLTEEVTLLAENYTEALNAVGKHIARQHVGTEERVVVVHVDCAQCGQIYTGYEHIDCSGHKDLTQEELLQKALEHDNRYRKFKKLHSHHSMVEGYWHADGAKV